MRIRRVSASQPVASNSPPDWRTSMGQIAVEIETEEGLAGLGVGGGGRAAIHIIDAVLGPWLAGRDLEPIEEHWRRMYELTLPFGRKGVAIMALSGVDLALWDLRARAAGVSVAELLGGAHLDRPLPTYTTVWDEVDAATAGRRQAVKLHVHPEGSTNWEDEVVRRTEAARNAIGPDRQLMIDAWMEWDVESTLRLARRLAPLGLAWIEEPLPADDLAGYRRLRDDCGVPIAGGEHEFTAAGFEPLIRERLHSVLQPDACWVGGMTEMVKIYQMARGEDLRVIPHRGVEVWGLHAIAGLDSQPLAESPRPWMQWVEGQPQIDADDAIMLPAETIGFGVHLRAEEAQRRAP